MDNLNSCSPLRSHINQMAMHLTHTPPVWLPWLPTTQSHLRRWSDNRNPYPRWLSAQVPHKTAPALNISHSNLSTCPDS